MVNRYGARTGTGWRHLLWAVLFAILGSTASARDYQAPVAPMPTVSSERGMPTAELDLFKIALGQSPMAATMLLAIWMFKREFQRMLALNDQKSETQNKLIADCMIAITRNTAFTESCQRALEANTSQSNAAAAAINLLVSQLDRRRSKSSDPNKE